MAHLLNHLVYDIMSDPHAGKQISVVPTSPSQSCQHQVVCLLVSSQEGARNISHMMFNAPGVNFALVNPVMYGNSPIFCISIRVSSDSLHQLWCWLLSSSQEVLLAYGLVALALGGGTLLWLKDPSTITSGQFHLEVHFIQSVLQGKQTCIIELSRD